MSEAWKQWEGRIVDGKFPLRQYLGSSEHSAVFLTERGEPAQKVAIKFIQVEPVAAETQFSRWQRAARLSHSHLLKLFDWGRCRIADFNLLYVVMEFANENLGEFLPQRPLTPAETRDVLVPTLDALALLHREGLVHGHIQPSNILAIEDQLKLSGDTLIPAPVVRGVLSGEDKSAAKPDPGAAPVATGDEHARPMAPGGESATLRRPSPYCAPEALKGAATPAADIWSLGMTLVEMLTQRPPAYDNALRQDPALPETLPALFAEIARHCLRRDPQARWTVAQIAERLNPGSSVPAQAAAASGAANIAASSVSNITAPSTTPSAPIASPATAAPIAAASSTTNVFTPPPVAAPPSPAPVAAASSAPNVAAVSSTPNVAAVSSTPNVAAVSSTPNHVTLLAGVPVLAPPPAPARPGVPPVTGLRPPAPTVTTTASAAPARTPAPVLSKSEPYHIPSARPPLHSARDAKHPEMGLPKLKQPPLMPKVGYFVGGIALGLLIFALIGIKIFSHRGVEQQQAAAVAPQQPAPTETKAAPPTAKGKPAKGQAKPDAKVTQKASASTVPVPSNAQKSPAPVTTHAASSAQPQRPTQSAQTTGSTSNAAATPANAAPVKSAPAESAAVKSAPITSVTDKQPVAPPASSHNDSLSAATVPAGLTSGSIVKGEILNQVIPDVSEKARATIRGTVRVAVKVHVDSTGNVAAAELNSPGPSKFFADKALEAAKSWDFSPAKLDGHNVASSWVIRFHFTQAGTQVFPAEETP